MFVPELLKDLNVIVIGYVFCKDDLPKMRAPKKNGGLPKLVFALDFHLRKSLTLTSIKKCSKRTCALLDGFLKHFLWKSRSL